MRNNLEKFHLFLIVLQCVISQKPELKDLTRTFSNSRDLNLALLCDVAVKFIKEIIIVKILPNSFGQSYLPLYDFLNLSLEEPIKIKTRRKLISSLVNIARPVRLVE